MHNDKIIRKLKTQLLIERIAIAAIVLTLIIVSTAMHFRAGKSLIMVDGKPVVCVQSAQEAEGVLSQIKSQTGCNPSEVEFQQEVRVARAPVDARPVSRHKAYSSVNRLVCALAPRWAIIVNGEPIAALPDKKTAAETLELAKMKFGSMAKNLAEEPQFKQKVSVDITAVQLKLICKTAQQAVDLIFSGKPSDTKDAVYIVKDGDIAGSIAQKFVITLDEMTELNRGTDLARLQIGDKVNVKAAKTTGPKLTVIVRDLSENTETIPAPVQYVSSARLVVGKSFELAPGKSGERQVKIAAIYENGKRVGSEVVSEEILREASPRRIAQGIKSK